MSMDETLCRTLAPDDARPGDYVAILAVVREYVVWHCERIEPDVEVHRAIVMPDADDVSAAYRVVDVCLPYLLVKQPDGKPLSLDTRRYRLARLSPRFGRETFRRIKAHEAKDKVNDKTKSDVI